MEPRVKCCMTGCNQWACLASGDEKLCGSHWRTLLDRNAAEVDRRDLLDAIDALDNFSTIEDVRTVLRDIAERLLDGR